MLIEFNESLFEAVRPRSLSEFWVRVLNRPLPSLSERGLLYEEYELGPADEYVGSAVQNENLLAAISGQE